jgi:phenylpyruvate tautomerase PptA (4-oxalocrotonate tautomerase family)
MPIVDIEIVGEITESNAGACAQALADEAARVFASPPANTWVRVHTLARECYAENGIAVAPSDLPVFVTVLKRQVPQRAPGRVHVEYAAAAAGRMAFGGTLIE